MHKSCTVCQNLFQKCENCSAGNPPNKSVCKECGLPFRKKKKMLQSIRGTTNPTKQADELAVRVYKALSLSLFRYCFGNCSFKVSHFSFLQRRKYMKNWFLYEICFYMLSRFILFRLILRILSAICEEKLGSRNERCDNHLPVVLESALSVQYKFCFQNNCIQLNSLAPPLLPF